jgi:predicted nucleic acid-binding protein
MLAVDTNVLVYAHRREAREHVSLVARLVLMRSIPNRLRSMTLRSDGKEIERQS